MTTPTILKRGIFIWMLGTLFYCYQFFLKVSPSVMVPELMRTFQVDALTLGRISAFYFYAYAGMQIPVGLLLDRFGARRLLFVSSLLCTLGCLCFAKALTIPLAELGRLIIGMGAAFALISTLKLMSNWLPAKRIAFFSGLTLAAGMLGAILGETILSTLVDNLGWRSSLMLLFFIGLVLWSQIALWVREYPSGQCQNTHNSSSVAEVLRGLNVIIRNPYAWSTALFSGLMYAPTEAFASLWGTSFLVEHSHYTRHAAGFLVSFIFLGYLIGAPIFGAYSDRTGSRKKPMLLGAIGSFVSLTAVIYAPSLPHTIEALFLFAYGFFGSAFFIAFTLIREIHTPEVTGTALGFINGLNMIGGAILQPTIGRLLDKFWLGDWALGARTYHINAYHHALAILPIILFAAICLWPFLPDGD